MNSNRVGFQPLKELYPFESRWFNSTAGSVHYVPDNTVVPLTNAGHFIQEDAPLEIASAIRARFSS